VSSGYSAAPLGHVDVSGLVEVGDPPALDGCLLDAADDPSELGGEDLILGGWFPDDEGLLAGEQHVGTQQDVAHLGEHERVQLLGADPLLGATHVGPARAQRVVVGAAVVAVLAGSLIGGGAHLLGVGLDVAGSADDEPAQQLPV
jgi:hypothetical protein